jgi:hypothetical protein
MYATHPGHFLIHSVCLGNCLAFLLSCIAFADDIRILHDFLFVVCRICRALLRLCWQTPQPQVVLLSTGHTQRAPYNRQARGTTNPPSVSPITPVPPLPWPAKQKCRLQISAEHVPRPITGPHNHSVLLHQFEMLSDVLCPHLGIKTTTTYINFTLLNSWTIMERILTMSRQRDPPSITLRGTTTPSLTT